MPAAEKAMSMIRDGADALDEFSRQVVGVHGLEEGALDVEVRDHDRGADFFAGVEHDAAGLAAADHDLVDRRIDANLAAGGLERTGQGLGDGAHAAAGKAP